MSNILFIFAAFPYFLVGFMVLQILKARFSGIETVSFSFGLGYAFIGFQMLVMSYLSLEWNRQSLILPWLFLLGAYLLLNKKLSLLPKFSVPKFSKIEAVFFVMISSLFLFLVFESQLRPLIAWDGWATWIFRAKVFYFEGSINPETLNYYGSNYPLLVSLSNAAFYYFLGFENDRYILILYPIFYLSALLLFYSFISQKTTRIFAIAITFAVFSFQLLIRQGGRFEAGQADLILAYFILASSILLVKFFQKADWKILLLLSFFLGATSIIKNEGMPFVIMTVLITVFLVLIKKRKKHLILLIPAMLPMVEWTVFKNAYNFPETIHFMNESISLSGKILPILKGLAGEVIDIKRWSLLWIGFLSILPTLFIKRIFFRKELFLFYILTLGQLLVYIAIFILTPHPLGMYIPNVIDRLLLHISLIGSIPTALILATLTNQDKNVNGSS